MAFCISPQLGRLPLGLVHSLFHAVNALPFADFLGYTFQNLSNWLAVILGGHTEDSFNLPELKAFPLLGLKAFGVPKATPREEAGVAFGGGWLLLLHMKCTLM